MTVSVSNISALIQNYASSRNHIAAVYLFGSAARGKMRPSSDIDIAIMSTHRIGGFEKIDMETELSNLLHRDVDLVIFHQAQNLLQHQILKYGVLLFEQDVPARIKQETAARREYLDTRFLFKELTV